MNTIFMILSGNQFVGNTKIENEYIPNKMLTSMIKGTTSFFPVYVLTNATKQLPP